MSNVRFSELQFFCILCGGLEEHNIHQSDFSMGFSRKNHDISIEFNRDLYDISNLNIIYRAGFSLIRIDKCKVLIYVKKPAEPKFRRFI